jgi:hypothetical protein
MINIVSNEGFNEKEYYIFRKIGYGLPKDYIEFLRHHNGGYGNSIVVILKMESKYFDIYVWITVRR